MSWAQLSNRPDTVSPAFNNNTYPYAKPINHITTANNVYHVPPTKVATTSSKRKHEDIQFVVLDSGAFIGRQSFFNNFNQTVRYFMTPAVHHEIKDKQSRRFLDNFPYEIIVKKPEPQSLQFVSQFIAKHQTLKSMSKVDRHIIALAHTLEIQQEGTKNVSTLKRKQKKGNKAVSVTGANGAKDRKSNNKHLKKSRTGRIHTQVVPLSDTGVRLSKLKKVIHFDFDEFMTLNKGEYGEKYGKPTHVEHAAFLEKNKDEIKYNPNVKASSECNNDESNDNNNAISKAQRRRKRKKMRKKSSVINKEETMNVIGINENKEKEAEEFENAHLTREKSEIEKMIEEDLNTTFNETASLISSLSEHSNRHLIATMNTEAQSAPHTNNGLQANNNNVAFGTMFNGAQGSLFGAQTQQQTVPQLTQEKGQRRTKKKTIADAWDGEWLTPENYKAIAKNTKAKKKTVKNAKESINCDSSVAVITIDKAMQKCMVEMGLRVMTTSSERQYGGASGAFEREAIDYMFRCYGCFQYEHNTTRTNCRWCGGQTFQRVAIYEDENGKHHYRFFYRDRYASRYLDKHQLVPRGSQLVKYKENDHQNQENQHRNQKKKKKKRGAIYNNNQFRNAAQRW